MTFYITILHMIDGVFRHTFLQTGSLEMVGLEAQQFNGFHKRILDKFGQKVSVLLYDVSHTAP